MNLSLLQTVHGLLTGVFRQRAAPVGEDFDLTYNGENMVLDTVALGYEEGSLLDVTLTLDLSNFDYPSKQGAKDHN